MKITIQYKLVGQEKWKTVRLSPEDYFDVDYLEPGEKCEIDSVAKYYDEISYLRVNRRSVQYTKLTIIDPAAKDSKTITRTYWGRGKNFISEHVYHDGRKRTDWEIIVAIELPTTPPVSEIIRIVRKNGNISPYYHGFIIDNPDGSQKEIKMYPTRQKSRRFHFKRKRKSRKL
jgi:hypothetical protein